MSPRHPVASYIASVLPFLACLGCADESGRPGGPYGTDAGDGIDLDDSGDDSGGDEDELLDVGPGDGDGGDGDSACECAPKSDKIFLLSATADLWLFDPSTNEFSEVGNFDCGVPPETFSMGVARDGKAWIMFRPDGDIYTVDVNDANQCEDPGYVTGQLGYTMFGMAFALQNGDACDHLYLHSFDDVGWSEGNDVGLLTKLSAGMSLSPVAPIDYNGGELTGTGDGRLFAFAGVPQAKLVEYDPETGDAIDTLPLPGLTLTYAFAFAFWGGDFYFFTESADIGSPSKVTKLDYDGSDGNGVVLTTIVSSAPLRVVGAGVSTCAPFEPQG